MKAVFLGSAEADLHDLRDHIVGHFGAAAWRKSYRKIKTTVAAIEQHPLLGKVPPELASLGMEQYRQVISDMNRIIYEVRGDTAYIHIICDTRRDLQPLLLRRIVRGQ